MKVFSHVKFIYSADLFRPDDVLDPNSSVTFDREVKFDATGIGGSNIQITTPEIIQLDWTIQHLRGYLGKRIMPTGDTTDAAYLVRASRPLLSLAGEVELYVYTLARI